MTDQNSHYSGAEGYNTHRFVEQASAEQATGASPQQGMGPYTLREWIVLGAAVLLLLLSFFSRAQASTFIGYVPVWTLGIAWIPAVVLPVLAAALIALRRVNEVRSFGSLSVDQFASVTFVGAAITWLHVVVTLGGLASWSSWVALVVAVAGVFFTVFARFVAPFSEDFTGRADVPAHVAARPVRPLAQPVRVAAPAPEAAPQANPFAAPAAQQADPFAAPAAQQSQVPSFFEAPVASTENDDLERYAPQVDSQPAAAEPAVEETALDEPVVAESDASEPVDADLVAVDDSAISANSSVDAESAVDEAPEAVDAPVVEEPVGDAPVAEESVAQPATTDAAQPVAGQQAFWALAPEERDVHDFDGHAIYKIGPTAWALVLEDRGTYFVMRHDDGRIGYLHNVAGVTRG